MLLGGVFLGAWVSGVFRVEDRGELGGSSQHLLYKTYYTYDSIRKHKNKDLLQLRIPTAEDIYRLSMLNNLNRQLKSQVANLPFLVLGAFSFWLVIGGKILNPTNIGWLLNEDTSQHYLGWAFFKNTDWSFPLGANPNYGLELSSSIVFSDSNPLFALLFKPFEQYLPDTFQYIGIWYLMCFLMQAVYAGKLIKIFTKDKWYQLFGASVLVMSPPMITRSYGHDTLVGHFLILIALYFCFRKDIFRRKVNWSLLLATVSLVHVYLMAMVMLLWMTDLGSRWLKRQLTSRTVALEFVIVFGITLFVCWQAGYFMVGKHGEITGYAYYKMNLLSLFDPSGWSYILKDIPQGKGEYEGFNYLGAGAILLLICSLAALPGSKVGLVKIFREYWVLLIVFFCLGLFAVSNKVGLAGSEFHIPIPESISNLADIFRSSGRMFWPVYYSLILFTLFVVVRSYPRKSVLAILIVASVTQYVDTSARWRGSKSLFINNGSDKWKSSLIHPFWENAAQNYDAIHRIYPRNRVPEWREISKFAATNGMATDVVYIARINLKRLVAAQHQADLMLSSGKYDDRSLYILEPSVADRARSTLNHSKDAIFTVDGYTVLAPGWKACESCISVESLEVESTAVSPGQKIGFGASQVGIRLLSSGWSEPEPWGTWSNGSHSRLNISTRDTVEKITFTVSAYVRDEHPEQRLTVSLNEAYHYEFVLTKYRNNRIEIQLPEPLQSEVSNNKQIQVRFDLPDAVSPADLGINDDNRRLGVGLFSMELD